MKGPDGDGGLACLFVEPGLGMMMIIIVVTIVIVVSMAMLMIIKAHQRTLIIKNDHISIGFATSGCGLTQLR